MLPWAEMLRSAIGLQIAPDVFWRLSMKEWRWLAGGGAGLTRQALDRLQADYPDRKDNQDG